MIYPDSDVTKFDDFGLGFRHEPALTSISIKHIEEIYDLCDMVQNLAKNKADTYITISSLCLSISSIMGCFNLKIGIIIFLILGVITYGFYFINRKQEKSDAVSLAKQIERLMPVSKVEMKEAINAAKSFDEARLNSFIDHLKSPYS